MMPGLLAMSSSMPFSISIGVTPWFILCGIELSSMTSESLIYEALSYESDSSSLISSIASSCTLLLSSTTIWLSSVCER